MIGDVRLLSVLKVIWSFFHWIGSFVWKTISYRGPRQIPAWKEPAMSWVMLLCLGWSALTPSVVSNIWIPSVAGKEYWLWKSVVFVVFNASPEMKPVVLCMALELWMITSIRATCNALNLRNLSNYLVKKNLLFTRETLRTNNAFNCYCPYIFLSQQIQRVSNLHWTHSVYCILSSFIFLLSSLLEEESTNISLEQLLAKWIYICVHHLLFLNRKASFHKNIHVGWKVWASLSNLWKLVWNNEKEMFCPVKRHRNISWS